MGVGSILAFLNTCRSALYSSGGARYSGAYVGVTLSWDRVSLGGRKMRMVVRTILSAEEKAELERLARGRQVPARVEERARSVLLAPQGKQNREIARLCGVVRKTVSLWRRFVEKRSGFSVSSMARLPRTRTYI
jgi:hypothetical protein